MNITPHFTLEDMTHSDNAIRHGIANTASPEIIANLTRLCGVLEKFRSYIGHPIKVSSGYRNHAVNQLAGSSDTSAHTKGLAADIEVDGISPKSLCKLFVMTGLDFDQVIFEGTWMHLGLSEGTQRKEILTAHFSTGQKATYTRGL